MEAALFVYFAGMVSKVSSFFNFSSFIILTLTLICAVGWVVWSFSTSSYTKYYNDKNEQITETQENELRFKKGVKPILIGFVIAIFCKFFVVLIPEEKTVWYMAGAYVGQKALQSEMASDMYDIIKFKVKAAKEELMPEIVEQVNSTKDQK